MFEEPHGGVTGERSDLQQFRRLVNEVGEMVFEVDVRANLLEPIRP